MAEIDFEIIEKIKRIVEILKKQNVVVHSAYLYGSHARGNAGKWSDIDIALISRDFMKDRTDERIRLMKIALEVDNRIEPVPFRPETFTDSDPLAWEIKHNGISIPLS